MSQEMNPIDQLELQTFMANYSDLNAKIKALEDKKNALRSKILINIKTHEIENYEYNGIVLFYSMQKRKVLDKAKLEAFLNARETRITDFEIENQIEMLRIQTRESIEKYKEGK